MSKEDGETEAFVVIPCDSVAHALATERLLKSEGWGCSSLTTQVVVDVVKGYLMRVFRVGGRP